MKESFGHIDKFRVRQGLVASTPAAGRNGFFLIPIEPTSWVLYAMASDQYGWEHVSVRVEHRYNPNKGRIPTWEEMCLAKSTFWDPEECVIQFHPPESQYVNQHPHVLHLWRCIDEDQPLPPSILVGRKK